MYDMETPVSVFFLAIFCSQHFENDIGGDIKSKLFLINTIIFIVNISISHNHPQKIRNCVFWRV